MIFKAKSPIAVKADTIHEPDDGIATRKVRFYVLELDWRTCSEVQRHSSGPVLADRSPVPGGIAPHPYAEV